MPIRLLLALFHNAFREFLDRERRNILADISERNLCGRLMLYLDIERERYKLQHYFTDTEYNRNLGDPKRIRHNPNDKPDLITCDLIVHSRGQLHPDNLIAIEMKKKKHKQKDKDSDRRRLEALTRPEALARELSPHEDHVYGYYVGLFIELDTEKPSFLIETYEKGKKTSEARMDY